MTEYIYELLSDEDVYDLIHAKSINNERTININEFSSADIIKEKAKLLCKVLAKTAPSPTHSEGYKIYKFHFISDLEFKNKGDLSQAFERCLFNKAKTISQNVTGRNCLFAYCLKNWIQDNNLHDLLPKKLFVDALDKWLYNKLFLSKDTLKDDKIKKEISNLLDRSSKAAAKFLFSPEINKEYYSSTYSPTKHISMTEIQSYIKTDFFWHKIFTGANGRSITDLACDILSEVKKQPLLYLLMEKWADYTYQSKQADYRSKYDEARENSVRAMEYQHIIVILIKHSMPNYRFDEKQLKSKVVFMPLVTSLDNYVTNSLRNICQNTEYTVNDILNYYGQLAEIASKNDHF